MFYEYLVTIMKILPKKFIQATITQKKVGNKMKFEKMNVSELIMNSYGVDWLID